MNRHAGDKLRLRFVGDEIIGGAQLLQIRLLSRGWIHNAADAFGFCETHRVIDGAKWNLELHHDGVCFRKKRGGGIDVLRRKGVVRAFYYDDAILAVGINKNWGDAACYTFCDAHLACVDALRFKVFYCGGAEQVAANFRDHRNRRAGQSSSDSLIGALAAKAQVKFFAEDGFARPRKHVIERGEVHVGAAYDCNEGLLRHPRSSGVVRSRFQRTKSIRSLKRNVIHPSACGSARGLYRNSGRKQKGANLQSASRKPDRSWVD